MHDSIAPTLGFVPPAAGYVRGAAQLRIDAADPGSAIHALGVTAAGQPLGITAAPPLPSPASSAVTVWDTTTVADGSQALTASATDGAANVQTVSRSVIVDNTPPETEISAGPPPTVAEPEVTFAFTGTDALAPPTSLTFSWRVDDGEWSAFSSSAGVVLSGLGQGLHVFEVKARDVAGNEDATPATRAFAVQLTQLSVSITSPVAGATLPAGPTLVRGVVDAGGAEVGVTVNGVVASRQGDAFVALVDLGVASSALVAVASSVPGATAEHVVPISVAMPLPGAPSLRASPVRGLAPLEVRFLVEIAGAFARMELDANGDGAVDVTTPAGEAAFTFVTPGTYVAAATVVDAAGNRTVTYAVVEVLDLAAFDTLLQARWSSLKDALRRSDVSAALTHVAARSRARYASIFQALSPDLPDIDRILTALTPSEVVGHEAIYEMSRDDDGLVKSFEVRFVLDEDGLWRLWSF